MSKPIRPIYKTKNWPAYNASLKKRGSLTVWFDPKMCRRPEPSGKRGPQPIYSDATIQTCLTMKVLFGMALRQTTGFAESLLQLVGLDWDVPTSALCVDIQKTLPVRIPNRGSQGPLHLLIRSHGLQANHCRAGDSTGIKAEGVVVLNDWEAEQACVCFP